jgi:hypothetical protein
MEKEDDLDYSYMFYVHERNPVKPQNVTIKQKPCLTPYQKILRQLYKHSSSHRRFTTRR